MNNILKVKSKIIKSTIIVGRKGENFWFKTYYLDGHNEIRKVKTGTYLYRLYSRLRISNNSKHKK